MIAWKLCSRCGEDYKLHFGYNEFNMFHIRMMKDSWNYTILEFRRDARARETTLRGFA